MLPAMSLTAVAVGAVLLLLGVVYTALYNREKRLFAYVVLSLLLGVGVFAGFYFDLFGIDKISAFFENQENGRLPLFKNAWENFLAHPLFGAGMGRGNTGESVLNGFWTHNYVLQILGSMGILGALAFGYQFFVRMRLVFRRMSALRIIVFLSYLGIFLASMLQPGEFCPMPYELLAVALFVILERDEASENPRVPFSI
jgi:O-antigen ligase